MVAVQRRRLGNFTCGAIFTVNNVRTVSMEYVNVLLWCSFGTLVSVIDLHVLKINVNVDKIFRRNIRWNLVL